MASKKEKEITWEEQQAILRELDSLYLEIRRYDYIGIKIATGVSTIEEYADKLEYVQTLRDKINELKAKLPESYTL